VDGFTPAATPGDSAAGGGVDAACLGPLCVCAGCMLLR
jgi:hypothetical protein